MQTLNTTEAGIFYLFRCMKSYSEGCSYFLLYFAALVFLALKGKKEERLAFLPQAGMLLFTVFNPVFPLLLNRIFDVNKEYYRFFWIAPVLICISYVSVKLVFEASGAGIRKWIAGTVFLLLFVTAGSFIYEDGYVKAENIYQMPAELIQADELIHQDTDVPYPKVMFEYDFHMLIRQYDASILLPCGRDEYLSALSEGISPEMLEDDTMLYTRLLAVAALGMYVDHEDFYEAMEHTNTEYFVVSKGSRGYQYLTGAGLHVIGETVNHAVLRYDMKEPWVFQLEDYSKIWKSN